MRQRFDHLVEELSFAVGAPVHRYRLWLRLHEHGVNPNSLTARMAVAFCDGPLASFLAEEGLELYGRSKRRLRKAVLYYEPTPQSEDDEALAEFHE